MISHTLAIPARFFLSVIGLLLIMGAGLAFTQTEQPKEDARLPWQTDVEKFEAALQKIKRETKVPDVAIFEKRVKDRAEDIDILTDGAGGVIDFSARKGSPQHEANQQLKDKPIEWEFELMTEAKPYSDGSITLMPKLSARPADKLEEDRFPFFTISVEKPSETPWEKGQRIKLTATIDDFSRFQKDLSDSFGIVAIYYFEDDPGPFFMLKLNEAKITKAAAEVPAKASADAGESERE